LNGLLSSSRVRVSHNYSCAFVPHISSFPSALPPSRAFYAGGFRAKNEEVHKEEAQEKPKEEKEKETEGAEEKEGEPRKEESNNEEEYTKQIKELQEALADTKDDLLRSLADRENLLKIWKKNVENAKQFSVKSFAEDLLDVSDNLERALDHAPKEQRENNQDLQIFYEGVDMTHKVLLKVFAKHGIKKFVPEVGEKFDPKYHAALFQVPDPSKPPGAIAVVQSGGFSLHERLLRPAQVGVVAPPAESKTEDKGEEKEKTPNE